MNSGEQTRLRFRRGLVDGVDGDERLGRERAGVVREQRPRQRDERCSLAAPLDVRHRGAQQVGLAGTGWAPQEDAGLGDATGRHRPHRRERLGVAAGQEIAEGGRLGRGEFEDELFGHFGSCAAERRGGRHDGRRRSESGKIRRASHFTASPTLPSISRLRACVDARRRAFPDHR